MVGRTSFAVEQSPKRIAVLQLELVNGTERHYEDVELTVRYPSAIAVAETATDLGVETELREEPLAWGKHTIAATIHGSQQIGPAPAGHFSQSHVELVPDEYTVRWDPEKLRPVASVRLDPVYLAIPRLFAGSEVILECELRADAFDGVVTDALAVPVEPLPVDPSALFAITDD